MIQTDQFIVLHSIKYRESDLLIYVYSYLYGRQTCLLRSARTAKKHSAAARIFPLNVIDAEVYHTSGAQIHLLKSLQPAINLAGMRADLYKSSIALFLGEVLYKSIKEEEANPPLYRFLIGSIQELNDLECSAANFHLYFLTQFCTYLGYAPFFNYDPELAPLFDMAQGAFVPSGGASERIFSGKDSALLHQFHTAPNASATAAIPLNAEQRHLFINALVHYLSFHLNTPIELKSLVVLQQVLQ